MQQTTTRDKIYNINPPEARLFPIESKPTDNTGDESPVNTTILLVSSFIVKIRRIGNLEIICLSESCCTSK